MIKTLPSTDELCDIARELAEVEKRLPGHAPTKSGGYRRQVAECVLVRRAFTRGYPVDSIIYGDLPPEVVSAIIQAYENEA